VTVARCGRRVSQTKAIMTTHSQPLIQKCAPARGSICAAALSRQAVDVSLQGREEFKEIGGERRFVGKQILHAALEVELPAPA
jgi:hypothetical protein